VLRIQIEIISIEIGSQEKQANRVAPLISGCFSLLFYDWISDSRKSYRRREISSLPTIHWNKEVGKRSVLSRFGLSLVIWSEGCCASRISHFAPSRSVTSTISYAKQPPGQVLFECLRNRRFCPSSDEHHCLSICLSVYRIDIRESGRIEDPVLSSSFPLISPSLLFLSLPRRRPLQTRRCTFVPLWEKLARASFPLLFFVRCGGFRFHGKKSMRRERRRFPVGFCRTFSSISSRFSLPPLPFSLLLLRRGFSISRDAPLALQELFSKTGYVLVPFRNDKDLYKRTPKSISRFWLLKLKLVSNWMDACLSTVEVARDFARRAYSS